LRLSLGIRFSSWGSNSKAVVKMESDWDLLQALDPDVSTKILMCLDDPADIVRASSVSRSWRDFGKCLVGLSMLILIKVQCI